MKVTWNFEEAHSWDSHHARMGGALQQDWAYGACMKALGVQVLRGVVTREGEPLALAQFIVRFFGGKLASMAVCSMGPVWLAAVSAHEKKQAYQILKKTIPLKKLRLVLFTPCDAAASDLGLSSWRRVMTGQSTVVLDIAKPLEDLRAGLDRRWRAPLMRAESSELKIHRVGTNAGQYRWLLDVEMQQREKRGFMGLPLQFFDLYVQSRGQPSKNILTIRADFGRDRVAGMMFLIHGEAATYHVGWNSDVGRDLHAHHLILWHGIQELKARGVRILDLGGVNTIRSAGIARFKISTGGQVITYAGSYF
jgi:hypothetical protein